MATVNRIDPSYQPDPGYEDRDEEEHVRAFFRKYLGQPGGRPIPEWTSAEERAIAREVLAELGLDEAKRSEILDEVARYSPTQPRDPGGEGGGQWIKAGAAAAAAGAAPTGPEVFKPEDIPDSVESFYTALADQDRAWVNWEADTASEYRQVAKAAGIVDNTKEAGQYVYGDTTLAKIRVQNTIAAALEGDDDFRSLIAALDPYGDWQAEFEPGGQFASADTVEKQVAALATATWARTSGDTDLISLQFQIAAEQEFGLEANPFVHEAFDALKAANAESGRATPDRQFFTDQQMAGARKFVRAQYDLTQGLLASEGLKEVVVYRGMAWAPRSTPPEIEALRSDRYGPGIIAVHGNPLSSWSRNFGTAQSFTSNYDVRAIAGTKVDARRILSTPFTGFGCLREGEFVVLGGTDMDAMTWAWNKQYIIDPEGNQALAVVSPQYKLIEGTSGPGDGALGGGSRDAAEVDFVARWASKIKNAKAKR